MNTKARLGNAECFGRRLGGLWCGFMRRDRGVVGWLVARGMPAGGATALLWIVKLSVLGLLLYGAFWLAMLLVFAVVAASVARNVDPDETPEPEWRNGPAGFGLYTYDGHRIDPHVSDDD